LLGDSITEAQEATMYHHSIALTLAEGRVADLQSAAPTAGPPRRLLTVTAAAFAPWPSGSPQSPP
jgi:hypothetical protein